jgi:Na+-translocating ferredoxin:NAD+ oxidoreductase subunit D
MRRAKILAMGDAPFVYDKRTSASLMWGTIAALCPALAWGLFCFGLPALLPVAASILGALVGEAIASGMMRKFTLLDGSAFLTGLLVGMAMPPGVSPYIPASASLFAIVIVKGAFGGLGSNWMNPALAGIAFALLNWPNEMSAWVGPRHLARVAGISGATPLDLARANGIDFLAAVGARSSDIDASLTDALNRGIFSPLGADLPRGYIDLLIGNKAGTVGELSAILILGASVLLISRKIIRWEIPASIIGSFALLTWVFGGLPLGNGFFAGDALFSVLTGSFLLVSFFMAPDPVTSPSSRAGMIVFGAGIGALSFLFRAFGATPEGSAFAVILMNCAVPALATLDRGAYKRRAARANPTLGAGGNGHGGR